MKYVNFDINSYKMNYHYQQKADLFKPTLAWHLLHLCYTSLQEFRHKQQAPVHINGNSKKHQALEAQPWLYYISVIPKC